MPEVAEEDATSPRVNLPASAEHRLHARDKRTGGGEKLSASGRPTHDRACTWPHTWDAQVRRRERTHAANADRGRMFRERVIRRAALGPCGSALVARFGAKPSIGESGSGAWIARATRSPVDDCANSDGGKTSATAAVYGTITSQTSTPTCMGVGAGNCTHEGRDRPACRLPNRGDSPGTHQPNRLEPSLRHTAPTLAMLPRPSAGMMVTIQRHHVRPRRGA